MLEKELPSKYQKGGGRGEGGGRGGRGRGKALGGPPKLGGAHTSGGAARLARLKINPHGSGALDSCGSGGGGAGGWGGNRFSRTRRITSRSIENCERNR